MITWPNTNDWSAVLKALGETSGLPVPSALPTNATTAKAAETAFLARCFKVMHDKLNERETKITALETTVKNLEQRLDALEKKPPQRLLSDFFNPGKVTDPEVKRQEAKLVVAASNETHEQEKRKRNVIIFGLPESEQSDASRRSEPDMNLAKEVFSKVNAPDGSVLRVHRLKKPSSDVARPGPLVVEVRAPSVEEMDARTVAIKNSKELQKHTNFKNVYIRPDLTMAQRERRRELIAARDEMNKNFQKVSGRFVGEHYFGIRDDRIVKILIKGHSSSPATADTQA